MRECVEHVTTDLVHAVTDGIGLRILDGGRNGLNVECMKSILKGGASELSAGIVDAAEQPGVVWLPSLFQLVSHVCGGLVVNAHKFSQGGTGVNDGEHSDAQ